MAPRRAGRAETQLGWVLLVRGRGGGVAGSSILLGGEERLRPVDGPNDTNIRQPGYVRPWCHLESN